MLHVLFFAYCTLGCLILALITDRIPCSLGGNFSVEGLVCLHRVAAIVVLSAESAWCLGRAVLAVCRPFAVCDSLLRSLWSVVFSALRNTGRWFVVVW